MSSRIAVLAVVLMATSLACQDQNSSTKPDTQSTLEATVNATVSATSPVIPMPTDNPTPTSSILPQTPIPTPTTESTPAPTPEPTSTPTPTLLPDLVIVIEARLKSNPSIVWGDGCVVSSSSTVPFHVGEVTARVGNVGGGDAGSFTVQLNNAVTETVDGLKAGAYKTVVFSTSARSEHVAVVDADSSIDESDESNNTAETFIPVPTLVPPAPTCTPTR